MVQVWKDITIFHKAGWNYWQTDGRSKCCMPLIFQTGWGA